ncbi:hypothetical protein ASPCADRAFT_202292 [Aspergillus carbonarius ITEM 5010]|uniref:Uncharacterized protein n=1 Tax=Aspergillus carbonarius (strain ITEM 5010) TaxID=602072 RepID=A0A1R3S0Y4_ASPC5|nr:hypothetical protein ASPCADRAFT_202292 [Aspergillus carbonarius ITEM 5010]
MAKSHMQKSPRWRITQQTITWQLYKTVDLKMHNYLMWHPRGHQSKPNRDYTCICT